MHPQRMWWRITTIVCSLAGVAAAHPGHGTTDPHSVTHYVAEPLHVAPMLVAMAAAAVTISLLGSRHRDSR